MTFDIDRRSLCIGIGAGAATIVGDMAWPSSGVFARNDVSERIDQIGYTIKGGEILSFQPVTVKDISNLSTIPQCLDNQWLPMSALDNVLSRGQSRQAVSSTLSASIRAEYVRSLINSEQIIINRAFLKNTKEIYQDFIQVEGSNHLAFDENREAFKRLISGGAIIPFFIRERSPVDEADYETVAYGAQGWLGVCRETAPRCLRMSWDDDINDSQIRRLLLNYHNFATTIKNTGGTLLSKLRYLRGKTVTTDEFGPFIERLRAIANYSDDLQSQSGYTRDGYPKSYVTRQQLYENFILVDGGSVVDGHYDVNKPFAAELKLLFDLKYATGLSDLLNVYALTPSDAPSRDILAEYEIQNFRSLETQTFSDPKELKRNLVESRRIFTKSILDDALNFRSFADFDLITIEATRNTPAWRSYISSLRELLSAPESFANPDAGFKKVSQAYEEVLKFASQHHGRRYGEARTAVWEPVVSLVITAGTTILSFVFPGAGPILYRAAPIVGLGVADTTAPFICRLVIGNVLQKKNQRDLENGIVFLRNRLHDAKQRAVELERLLDEDPDNFTNIAKSPNIATTEPTLNDPVDTVAVP